MCFRSLVQFWWWTRRDHTLGAWLPGIHSRNAFRRKCSFRHPHVSLLLNHLEKYVGLSGSVIRLLKSYYNHQQQFVNIISFHSSSTPSSGVICYVVIGTPTGNWTRSYPLLYLTATFKNYNTVSFETRILLSYFSWQSARFLFHSQDFHPPLYSSFWDKSNSGFRCLKTFWC